VKGRLTVSGTVLMCLQFALAGCSLNGQAESASLSHAGKSSSPTLSMTSFAARTGRQMIRPLQRSELLQLPNVLARVWGHGQYSAAEVRILSTANGLHGTYALYQSPQGLRLCYAFTRTGGHPQVVQPEVIWEPGGSRQELQVGYILPGSNRYEQMDGVLFGAANSPYLLSVEVLYRDTYRARRDISHDRGFVLVRPGIDPRHVQIDAFGLLHSNFWTHNTL